MYIIIAMVTDNVHTRHVHWQSEIGNEFGATSNHILGLYRLVSGKSSSLAPSIVFSRGERKCVRMRVIKGNEYNYYHEGR